MNLRIAAPAALLALACNFGAAGPAHATVTYTTHLVCRTGIANVSKETSTNTVCWYETSATDAYTGESSILYSWWGSGALPSKISVPDDPYNSETTASCGSDKAVRLSHALQDVNAYTARHVLNRPAVGSIMLVTYPTGESEGWIYTGETGDAALVVEPLTGEMSCKRR
jgi:hypothetical protein